MTLKNLKTVKTLKNLKTQEVFKESSIENQEFRIKHQVLWAPLRHAFLNWFPMMDLNHLVLLQETMGQILRHIRSWWWCLPMNQISLLWLLMGEILVQTQGKQTILNCWWCLPMMYILLLRRARHPRWRQKALLPTICDAQITITNRLRTIGLIGRAEKKILLRLDV